MSEERKENIQTGNPLGEASVVSLMVKFAVPSIIAMLVSALYNIVDQLFIGQAVGTLGNAATNVAFPLTTSCIALALMFGIGGASCFNLNMGGGHKDRAVYFVGNAIICLIGSGVILFLIAELFLTPLLTGFGAPENVLPYAQTYVRITAIGFPFLILTTGGCHLIRADGSPNMAMLCNLIGAVINTVLDAIFVMVFHWGMAGAALATIIGQIISAIIVIRYLLHFKTVSLTKEHFRPQIEYISKTAQIGMASFFNQVAMMVVQIIMNQSLKHYGSHSIYGENIPIACAGIITKVNMIFMSFVIGLSQGLQPIASFNYGAGKKGRVKEAYIKAISIGAVLAVIAFLMFQFFPRQIISIFGDGSELYYQFAIRYFHVFLFFTFVNFMQPITSNFFTAIGKPKVGSFLALTRQILFLLPLILLFPLFLGIDGIMYAGPVADCLAAVVCFIMVYRELRNFNQK